MVSVFDRMLEIQYANKISFNKELTEKINEFIEVIYEIDKIIPSHSSIKQLPGYQRLIKYKYIQNILYIENRRPENLNGPFDFSSNTIKKRIAAGYQDAAKALKHHHL